MRSLVMKVIILTVLFLALFVMAPLAVGMTAAEQVDPGRTILATLFVSFLFSVVLTYTIIRSRWSGWPLVATLFVVLYGIMTFLSQIETVVFLKVLTPVVPAEMIPKLFLQGLIIAAVFSPLAVIIHKRMKRGSETPMESNTRLMMPLVQWVWKLALIALLYIMIYVAFGALVFLPLAGEAFQAYYGDLQMPPWMLPFQAVRAMIWVLIALPVIRMMKGRWWEAGLGVSLLFSILMGGLLFIPNPLMPDSIRTAHLIEVLTSNFLFGWVVVWLLHRPHDTFRDLFSISDSPWRDSSLFSRLRHAMKEHARTSRLLPGRG